MNMNDSFDGIESSQPMQRCFIASMMPRISAFLLQDTGRRAAILDPTVAA